MAGWEIQLKNFNAEAFIIFLNYLFCLGFLVLFCFCFPVLQHQKALDLFPGVQIGELRWKKMK